GGYPGSAPPAGGGYPGSATGAYPTSEPPTTAAAYQTSAPPPGVYQGSAPNYDDLFTVPGENPPGAAPIGGEALPPTTEPPAKSRRGLFIGLVVVVAVFLLAVAGTVLVVKLSDAGGTSLAVNSCVRENGGSAKGVDCSDKDAFRIVSKVDKPESCSDANQPYIVLQQKGQKEQVLCLRPASQK
ncbi:hypothetical protein AB0367_18675, partial [Dactylosporangium sp. NPDC051484]